MPRHHAQWPLCWGTDIESADKAIDAGSSDDGVAVFVPVMCEGFCGWSGRSGGVEPRLLLWGVDWDTESEVVGGGGRCTQIEQPEVRI